VNSTETGLAGNGPAVSFDRSLGGLQPLQAIEYTKGEQKKGDSSDILPGGNQHQRIGQADRF